MKRVILLLALAGCDDAPRGVLQFETVVPPECAAQFAATVVTCAEAGNPLSDEEGEDLVAQCQRAARESWGAERPYISWQYVHQDCDYRCTTSMDRFNERVESLVMVCLAAGEP